MDTGVREAVGERMEVDVSDGSTPSVSELVAEDVFVAVAVCVAVAELVGVGGT